MEIALILQICHLLSIKKSTYALAHLILYKIYGKMLLYVDTEGECLTKVQ